MDKATVIVSKHLYLTCFIPDDNQLTVTRNCKGSHLYLKPSLQLFNIFHHVNIPVCNPSILTHRKQLIKARIVRQVCHAADNLTIWALCWHCIQATNQSQRLSSFTVFSQVPNNDLTINGRWCSFVIILQVFYCCNWSFVYALTNQQQSGLFPHLPQLNLTITATSYQSVAI